MPACSFSVHFLSSIFCPAYVWGSKGLFSCAQFLRPWVTVVMFQSSFLIGDVWGWWIHNLTCPSSLCTKEISLVTRRSGFLEFFSSLYHCPPSGGCHSCGPALWVPLLDLTSSLTWFGCLFWTFLFTLFQMDFTLKAAPTLNSLLLWIGPWWIDCDPSWKMGALWPHWTW